MNRVAFGPKAQIPTLVRNVAIVPLPLRPVRAALPLLPPSGIIGVGAHETLARPPAPLIRSRADGGDQRGRARPPVGGLGPALLRGGDLRRPPRGGHRGGPRGPPLPHARQPLRGGAELRVHRGRGGGTPTAAMNAK